MGQKYNIRGDKMAIYRKIDRYKMAIDEQRPFEGELLKELKAY